MEKRMRFYIRVLCWVSGMWSIAGGGFCVYIALRILLREATTSNRISVSGLLFALAVFLFALGFYIIRVFPYFLFQVLAYQLVMLKSMRKRLSKGDRK